MVESMMQIKVHKSCQNSVNTKCLKFEAVLFSYFWVFNFHCTFWVKVWESNHSFVISCLIPVAGSIINLSTMTESVVQYYH